MARIKGMTRHEKYKRDCIIVKDFLNNPFIPKSFWKEKYNIDYSNVFRIIKSYLTNEDIEKLKEKHKENFFNSIFDENEIKFISKRK